MEERITSMIPRYGKLNKIYTEIMSGGSFSFEKQQFISDFYRVACLPVRTSYLNRLPANEIFRTGICNGTGRFHIRRLFNNIRYEDAESYFFRLSFGHESRFLFTCPTAENQGIPSARRACHADGA